MKEILGFAVAVIWGSLSAQFLVQVVTSLIITLLFLSGIVFSKVSRDTIFAGSLASFSQTVLFCALLFGGSWITSEYVIDYSTLNIQSVAFLLAFFGTAIYCSRQVSGKILLARMCAWVPHFMETSMRVPRNERIAFARKWRMDSHH